jgi:putative endonuclease
MGAWVYILKCADGSLYVGLTRHEDLASRVWQHQTGALGGYTSARRPVKLVWSEHFDRITEAIAFERQVKGWRREKKLALIRRDWEKLPELARRGSSRE